MSEARRKKVVIIEILVVLSLFVLPNLVAGLRTFLDPAGRYPWTYTEMAWTRIEYGISVLPAVIFIAWRTGKGLGKFGLRGFVWWEGAALAVATLVAMYASARMIHGFFHGVSPEFARASTDQLKQVMNLSPHGPYQATLMVVSKSLGATAEEFIMRGYLITRLTTLVSKPLVATLIAAALFASYHIYEGPVATVAIFVDGLIFSVPFLVTKSIWPGVIAHTAYNIIAETMFR